MDLLSYLIGVRRGREEAGGGGSSVDDGYYIHMLLPQLGFFELISQEELPLSQMKAACFKLP